MLEDSVSERSAVGVWVNGQTLGYRGNAPYWGKLPMRRQGISSTASPRELPVSTTNTTSFAANRSGFDSKSEVMTLRLDKGWVAEASVEMSVLQCA